MTSQEGGNDAASPGNNDHCSIAGSSSLVDWDQPHTPYRNNAEKVLQLRINIDGEMTTTAASIDARHEQIQKIVEILCPFLCRRDKNDEDSDGYGDGDSDCPSHRFQIKPLTGGLSNHLFLVSDHYAKSVLVRIHPDANDNDNGNDNDNDNDKETAGFSIVDRETEPKFAVWLASHPKKLAPTVYGRFLDGRVEEFYANVRPLNCGEMKVYAPWIAERLASFHSLDAPPSNVLPRPANASAATVYETIDSWLGEAQAAREKCRAPGLADNGSDSHSDNDAERNRESDGGTEDDEFLDELSVQWAWLKNELIGLPPQQQQQQQQQTTTNHQNNVEDKSIVAEALDFIRRVAVTHMDCQPLNLLIGVENNDGDVDSHSTESVEGSEKDAASNTFVGNFNLENKLRLIDFEYAGWNPVAADIANTFCEYCEMSNLCADYDKEYPTPAQQDVFFWNYLLHSDLLRAKRFSSYSFRQQEQTQKNSNNNGNGNTASDNEWNLFSATLQQEVGRFSLLSHIGWAIWSIVKAQEQDGIDFDYMVYARHRMDGYAWAKKQFIISTE